MKFGVHTGLQNTSIDELRPLWRQIEGLGFEWISIWDHFYAADASGSPVCLEAVAAHAALIEATTRVQCGSLVYSVGYRHPAILANAMATLDHMSDGRVVLGMGAGWAQIEYDAYGIPFPPAPVRLRQLNEGIQCVRGLLTQDVTDFDGEFFTLKAARCEPKPVRDRLPIWIGGGGEKVTLRIAAQHADGWNVPFISPADYERKVAVLGEHCGRAGRDPSLITKAVNVGLAYSEEDLDAQFGGGMSEYVRPGVLMGSTQEMIDQIGAYGNAGAEWIIIARRAPFDADSIDRFAADVLPTFT
jgi:alkanesulfonate monooxygenase SsuD/methylene tetrahydromethanopterin reductase-like flavin-dependent oxidoreductase (luciferase family)